MNCQFCQQPTKNAPWENDYDISGWYDCKNCNISYRTYCPNGKVELIRFNVLFRNRNYCIDLDVTTNQTEILLLPQEMDDTIIIVLILPYIVEGLTPQNILSKLETYMTFS